MRTILFVCQSVPFLSSEGKAHDVSTCTIVASTSCGEDEACAAIPSAMSEAVLKAGNQEQGTGVCARIPKGGLPNASGLAGVPLPVAFFPLTGGDTRSWPVPEFAGIPMSVGLKDDDVFGR